MATPASGNLHPAVQAVRDSGAGKVKVAVSDIDGVLRGKYLHKDKFFGVADPYPEGGFGFSKALAQADRAILFKTGAKEIGARFGTMPSFMAKPHQNLPGCSGHIHQSLSDGNNNLFYDAGSNQGAENIARAPRTLVETTRIFKQSDITLDWLGDAFVALDVAKVVGLAATHEGDILDYAWDQPDMRAITGELPYFVALPTAAGTGSEVGRSSVISGGQALVPWLRQLKASIGIIGPLSAHGVRPRQLPRLVEIASADICHQTNPRPCTAADFEQLFKAAL